MGDFGTTTQLLLESIHRTSVEDQNRAAVALVKAMEFMAPTPYWFNYGTSIGACTTGQQEYPLPEVPGTGATLPHDVMRVRVSQIQVGDHWYAPMRQEEHAIIRELTYTDNGSTLGYPTMFSIYGKNLFLYSIPKDDFPWRIDYTKDLDRPRARYDGNWNIEVRDPGNPTVWIPITPSYTNDWLNFAEPAIRAWAEWELYVNYYKDQDNAVTTAQYFDQEETKLRALDTFRQEGHTQVRPTPI